MELSEEEKQKEIEVLASVIVTKAKRHWGPLRAMRGLKGFAKIAPKVIREVEDIGRLKGFKGADKKRMATEVILALIPVENWPWWMPKFLARYFIGRAIEAAVKEANKLWKKKMG